MTGLRPSRTVDLATATERLVRGLAVRPWGQVSASVYETARLVTHAPWLGGHERRLAYLRRTQRPDGWWVRPDGYGLAPTLSGVEALTATMLRGAPAGLALMAPLDLAAMAQRGLDALASLLPGADATTLPDTPAIELIIPTLIDAIRDNLDQLAAQGLATPAWRGPGQRPCVPRGLEAGLGPSLRQALATSAGVPGKILHSLEVLAPLPASASALVPAPEWNVGASPAATAAWLATSPARPAAAVAYLAQVVDEYDGSVPSVLPITAFERSWVLATLTGAGIDLPAYQRNELLDALAGGCGQQGLPGGAGLPPDADTTSVALLALEQAGRPIDPDRLLDYRVGAHFCTWPGERTASVSTNAHVLDLLATRMHRRGAEAARYGPVARRVAGWLIAQQQESGAFLDKWHASPLYGTAAAAAALARLGGTRPHSALRRCVSFALDCQRPGGAWGRWAATPEETAYAVHTLVAGGRLATSASVEAARVTAAVAAGCAYLRRNIDTPAPPLWHDKDLYTPRAVVDATVLAAIHRGERYLAAVRPGPALPRPRPAAER